MPMQTFLAKSNWLSEEGLRLDATSYASGGLEARDRIQHGSWRWHQLTEICQIYTEARFARTYVRDSSHGIPYLTGSDMLLADFQGLLYLSTRRTPQMKQLLIHQGWTLVSCSGTIGRTVFVRDEMDEMAASHDVIRCVPDITKVTPGYLFAFLSSAPAQAMLRQKTYGNVIQHIEPEHIADLPVPLPDSAEQERMHRLVVRAAEARTEASRLLDEASAYFDALAGPMLSSHDHAKAAGIVPYSRLNFRLDAFHHVGWATEARPLTGTPIGNLGRVSRPGIVKRIFVQRGIPFVSGIDAFQIRPSFRQRIMRSEAEKGGDLIQHGQILVQRSGQRYGLIGRPVYVGRRMHGWAASEHLMRITLSDKHDTARVFAFLRSEAGRRALMCTSYGTSIPELNPEGLASAQVPSLPTHLTTNVIRALELREQADELEEQAIQEVESWVS